MFSFTQIATSGVFGYWLDKRPMKEIMVFCLAMGGLGNSLYFFAPNIAAIAVARAISGVGGNISAAGLTYVIRVSSEEERSALSAKVSFFLIIQFLFDSFL